jgi:hypothetical protein
VTFINERTVPCPRIASTNPSHHGACEGGVIGKAALVDAEGSARNIWPAQALLVLSPHTKKQFRALDSGFPTPPLVPFGRGSVFGKPPTDPRARDRDAWIKKRRCLSRLGCKRNSAVRRVFVDGLGKSFRQPRKEATRARRHLSAWRLP